MAHGEMTTNATSTKGVCLVIGAGDATGGAIARRFAREGFITCVTRRSVDKLAALVAQIEAAGGTAHAFGSDARKEEEVTGLVERVESTIGAIGSSPESSRCMISRPERWRSPDQSRRQGSKT